MNLSLTLLLVAGFGAEEVKPVTFDSYTTAYFQAQEDHRPLLVVLNPGEQSKHADQAISLDEMSEDAEFEAALNNYVVAEIDTTTQHGKKVHALFNNASLPRIVVIDREQKKQIFSTSESLAQDEFRSVLSRYQSGTPVQTVVTNKPIIANPVTTPVQPAVPVTQPAMAVQGYLQPSCPNCQRFRSF